MIIQCAWCKRIIGEKEPLADTDVTHTICEKCVKEQLKSIDPRKDKKS